LLRSKSRNRRDTETQRTPSTSLRLCVSAVTLPLPISAWHGVLRSNQKTTDLQPAQRAIILLCVLCVSSFLRAAPLSPLGMGSTRLREARFQPSQPLRRSRLGGGREGRPFLAAPLVLPPASPP